MTRRCCGKRGTNLDAHTPAQAWLCGELSVISVLTVLYGESRGLFIYKVCELVLNASVGRFLVTKERFDLGNVKVAGRSSTSGVVAVC